MEAREQVGSWLIQVVPLLTRDNRFLTNYGTKVRTTNCKITLDEIYVLWLRAVEQIFYPF